MPAEYKSLLAGYPLTVVFTIHAQLFSQPSQEIETGSDLFTTKKNSTLTVTDFEDTDVD